ncbi:MAG: hypothetical protein KAQ87_00295 [Candidatus Pacebacteria bacterium]|nr:hypothetical protein [Candidatus Paceibacterota bacterium]
MQKIIPKINLNKKNLIKILAKCAGCKRLLFIISFGALLIFTFDIVYQHAFINIEFIDYKKDSSFIITNGKINNVNLNRVLKNINEDKKKIEIGIKQEYENPFKFKVPKWLDEFDYEIEYDNHNSNLDIDRDLDNDKSNEGESAD